MRYIVALEILEQRQLDFCLFGDRGQSNMLLFTVPAQSSAKTFVHTHTSAGGYEIANAVSRWEKLEIYGFGVHEGRYRATPGEAALKR